MKEIKDVEEYIGALLSEPNVPLKIIEEVKNVLLLLKAYELGLNQKLIPVDLFLRDVKLKEVPEIFHTLVAQAAVLKSKEASTITMDYLVKNCDKLLEEVRNYYQRRP